MAAPGRPLRKKNKISIPSHTRNHPERTALYHRLDPSIVRTAREKQMAGPPYSGALRMWSLPPPKNNPSICPDPRGGRGTKPVPPRRRPKYNRWAASRPRDQGREWKESSSNSSPRLNSLYATENYNHLLYAIGLTCHRHKKNIPHAGADTGGGLGGLKPP